MEKRYFILKKGYLNINQDFFYFSDDGEWKTCETLKETENPKLLFAYILEYLFELIIVIITLAIFMFLLFGEIEFFSKTPVISGIYFLLAIFHFVNRHYKIKYFKIPVDKIERLHLESQQLSVKFENARNQKITHKVKLDDEAEVEDIKKYLNEHFNQKYAVS